MTFLRDGALQTLAMDEPSARGDAFGPAILVVDPQAVPATFEPLAGERAHRTAVRVRCRLE